MNFLTVTFALIGFKLVAQLIFEWLNLSELKRQRKVPEVYSDFIDEETYKKSVNYTQAKSRLTQVEYVFSTVILVAILFSQIYLGYANWFNQIITGSWVGSLPQVWRDAIYIYSFLFVVSLINTPFSLYRQFVLEERFGFNKMSIGLWIKDFIKSSMLAFIFIVPLIALLLFLVNGIGSWWWMAGWAVMVGFQFLAMVLYPLLILPLFNRLTPLEDGELRTGVIELANQLDFPAKDIMVMDGSKRSAHSNAFFTGLGKAKKVVFFDTLVEQLSIDEMKAVFAHEVGHFKKKHILKSILKGLLKLLITFWVIDLLLHSAKFGEAFGVEVGNLSETFLILSLVAGVFTFWFTPVDNYRSRKNEFEADAFAKEGLSKNGLEAKSSLLIDALKKLYQKNLSNLTPHWLYSFFYYSHPTLLERENALNKEIGSQG